MSKDNRLAAMELPRLGRFVREALQQRQESLWRPGGRVYVLRQDKETVERTVAQSLRPNESERLKKSETVVNSSFQWR